MRAFVLHSYGPADRLTLTNLDKPVPAAGEALVRVRATSVNPYDWHLMRGEPYVARLMPGGLGVRTPKIGVLGCDMAGRVEAVGADVTGFRPGDDVYALLTGGGFGEYVCVPEALLAAKPKTLSYEEAAAMPMAAVTALQGLRDVGRVLPGQRVLVNGASGGVGVFAVQIAVALGAQVTGVCGTRNVELVRSLGADEVIDYTAADFTRGAQRYDLLLDCAGSRPVSACRRLLRPKGTFVVVGGPAGRWVKPVDRVISTLARGPFVSQRMALADAVGWSDKGRHLAELAELVEEGRLRPVVDRRYPFEVLPAAVEYQERGHASGKVVVTV
jgi:NADPH:quinone reductase-like Zn-dependent oxidoreductase